MSTWLFVVIDSCYYRAWTPIWIRVAAQVTAPLGFQVASGATYISLFFTALKSPVLNLFILPRSVYLSLPFLCQLLAPLSGVWSSLRSAMPYGTIIRGHNGHVGHGMSHGPAQQLTGGHVRLDCCPGTMVLGCCSFCVHFLAGPLMWPHARVICLSSLLLSLEKTQAGFISSKYF